MIVTVTMNPTIDKTVDVGQLKRGGLNRVRHVESDAGGKGINVSKTIRELGGESIAAGFIGGKSGEFIRQVLETSGIKTDFVEVEQETRTNMKVFEDTGEVTEINEQGPNISPAQLAQLLEKLEGYAKEDTLFVLAGSIPAGVPKDIYKTIIEKVHEKGAKVLLDADGEMFVNALEAGPDMIKPNREELQEYAEMDYLASEQELLGIARKLMEKGISTVAVSMGKSGAMFLEKDYQVKCPGLQVKAHSTVGAGDAMVAALSYAWDKGLAREEMVKTCMATSAGAVTTLGTKPPSRALVDELMAQVEIETID